jgi:hypothetical protein
MLTIIHFYPEHLEGRRIWVPPRPHIDDLAPPPIQRREHQALTNFIAFPGKIYIPARTALLFN